MEPPHQRQPSRLARQERSILGTLLLSFGSAAFVLAIVEVLLGLGLRLAPGWSAGPINGVLRRIHLAAEWPMIQYMPTCARWDATVTYTLRPPGCTVADREFTTRYEVNSAGLRDDNASLNAPRIIVLGDSYAMGWGVEQRDSFPELLEARLGMPVLNAGIPSYGTARELQMLERLDRSGLRALIIQFCWNDNAENAAWVTKAGRLDTLNEQAYDHLVTEHAAAVRYYPFKYLLTLVSVLRARYSSHGEALAGSDPAVDAAEQFLAVLAGHASLLDATPIIVLAACEHESNFSQALRAVAAASPQLRERLTVVDPSPILRPEDIYPLDGHWTAAGHHMVADLLSEELARRGIAANDTPPTPQQHSRILSAR